MDFIKKLFSKNIPQKMEVKNSGVTKESCESSFFSPFNLGLKAGISLLRNNQAWRYYTKVSPVFDSVKRKSRAMRTIKPAIYDTETGEYYHDFDSSVPATQLLKLLKKPNRERTWLDFVDSVVPSSEVTGDIFIMVTSMNEVSEPLEFFYINPDDLTPVEGNDGRVYSWNLNSNQWNETFQYQEQPLNKISSYFTKDGTKELWQIKEFNPNESNGDFFGMSPLSPIFLEIEQYEHSNVHNNSTLKNGATPSGALVVDKEFSLTDAQYQRMKEQINAKYSGAENAGNVLILEGGKDFKQLSMNNRDMDFLNLLKFVREQIYITKGIPLPMISGDSMTMNNFEESKYMMFDTDVLPFADKFYSELSELFMRRIDISGRYILAYDPEVVPALQVKKAAVNKSKIDTNVLTTNESRTLLGMEEISDGDVVLVPTSMIPLGQNVNQDNQEVKSYDYTTPAGRYRLQLEELTHDTGERKYSDADIDKKVLSLYGDES